jgi:hypothetical protein
MPRWVSLPVFAMRMNFTHRRPPLNPKEAGSGAEQRVGMKHQSATPTA